MHLILIFPAFSLATGIISSNIVQFSATIEVQPAQKKLI